MDAVFFLLPLAVAVGLWVLYRIIRGWLALVSERPMPVR